MKQCIPTLLHDLGSSKSPSRSSCTYQYTPDACALSPAHIINYRRYLFYCLAAFFFLVSNQAFPKAAKTSSDEPALLYADKLTADHELGLIVARGNVKIYHEDRQLKADVVTYNKQTGIITASGNVILTQPSGEVTFANYVEITGDLKNGIMREIRMIMADEAKLAAISGTRRDGTKTQLERSVYSPCKVCRERPDKPPVWQIKSQTTLWDSESHDIIHTDAFIEMFGVPVMYVPYLRHPDPTIKRRSGLLAPVFGYSSDAKTFIMVPYYYVISDDKDLTLSPLVTADEGFFLGGEYRQRLNQGKVKLAGSLGQGNRFSSSKGKSKQKVRGHIDSTLKYNINKDWRARLDVVRSTDQTYLRQFPYYGYVAENSLVSKGLAEGFYGRNYYKVEGMAFQTMKDGDPQSRVPLILPLLDMNYLSRPQGIGYRWSIDANALVVSRKRGTDTRRLSLKGGWQLPLNSPLGDVYTLSASVRGDAYHRDNFVPENSNQKEEGFRGRFFPQASVDWRYPFVSYLTEGQVILEPILNFVVSPKLNDQEKIPNEDGFILEPNDYSLFFENRLPGLDRIDDGTRFTYGFKSDVDVASELQAGLFLGQTYSFKSSREILGETGFEKRWSDYIGRIYVTVGNNLDLRYRFRVDRDNLRLRRSEFLTSVGDKILRLHVDSILLPRYTDEEESNGGKQLTISVSSEFVA